MPDNDPFPGPADAGKSVIRPATPEELEAAGFYNVAYALRNGMIREAAILPGGEFSVVPFPTLDRVTLSDQT